MSTLLTATSRRAQHWGKISWLRGRVSSPSIVVSGSDNGLSPGRRHAIIWTNAGISLIGPLGTNFSEILIEIHTFSFKKMHLKMSSEKSRPFSLGLNVLTSVLLAVAMYRNVQVIHNHWHYVSPRCIAVKLSLSTYTTSTVCIVTTQFIWRLDTYRNRRHLQMSCSGAI